VASKLLKLFRVLTRLAPVFRNAERVLAARKAPAYGKSVGYQYDTSVRKAQAVNKTAND